MRKIKFRLWDNENNCFYKPTYEAYKGNLEEILMSPSGDLNMRTFKEGTHIEILNHESNFPDRFIKIQFTGLKDKNGKEIYEGDICERNGHKYKIIFNEGAFGIENSSDPMDHLISMHHGHALYNYLSKLKIIGNIYSNPELIKQ